jgi:DNA-binding beta-propeller fold protein YncE
MAHVIRVWRTSRTIRLFVLVALLGTVTQLLSQESRVTRSETRQTKLIGSDRLVSVEPLSEMSGEICVYPEGADPNLMASLQQPPTPFSSLMAARLQQRPGGAAAVNSAPPRPSDAVRQDVARRRPTTTVRDPRNTLAGLALDTTRNEVVFAEENNFSVLVYDRLTNTPPRAALSEPKRTIQGENTFLEYACGVYVDPTSGDIYAINNDTLTWMTVFSRDAKGNVSPNRKLAIPFSSFAIVADEPNQELMMTVQDPDAVVTFKKSAKDQDAPVRLLQGPKTQMGDPHGLAIDPKANLIYVTNWGIHNSRRMDPPTGPRAKPNWPIGLGANAIMGTGRWDLPSITVYRKDAQGDVAPLRVIKGPKTMMNWPSSIAVHPDRNELFVANDTGDSITVYRADAEGDVAPIRVIKGPRSMVKNPLGVTLDVANNELWVANFGNHSATIYPVDANGDQAPKRVIRTARLDEPSALLSNPHTIAYDTKRENLLVSN